MSLKSEIYEQPAILRRILATQLEAARQVADVIRHRNISYVMLAARGTSDNAGIYCKYLWGAFNHLPVAMAAPSLFTMYGQPPRLRDTLVLAISQSGQSPDVISVLAEARRQGVPTVALTNDPGSPLAAEADFTLDIGAGPERAVAATKTYTATLMAIAMLSAALSADPQHLEALTRIPDSLEHALQLDTVVEQSVKPFSAITRCVVLGRGFDNATACEWSLKLKELTYVVAEPYSSADFRHGPIAMIEPGFPVMVIAPRGTVFEDMLGLLQTLNQKHDSDLVVISNDSQALSFGRASLPLPSDVPEWASPMVSIVPAQLFAYHLTLAKGLDPDAPRGLAKVTETL